jgi:hypothetical protein
MAKFMAVLRTVVLVLLGLYTLLVAPFAFWSGTMAITVDAMNRLLRATWLAIGWIGFETILAWIVVAFRRPPARSAPARSPGAGAPG